MQATFTLLFLAEDAAHSALQRFGCRVAHAFLGTCAEPTTREERHAGTPTHLLALYQSHSSYRRSLESASSNW